MVKLLHMDADKFLFDSFRLGRKVYETGFRPKHVISIWRGGTPVGLAVDAYYKSHGVFMNHTTVGTESYVGIGRQEEVVVKGLDHVIKVICPEDGLLILDDVYESGKTIHKIVETLEKRARANAPKEIMVATLHNKPEKHVWHELPHIFLENHSGDVWIDYPHELADHFDKDDPEDKAIKAKDPAVWEIVRREEPFPVENVDIQVNPDLPVDDRAGSTETAGQQVPSNRDDYYYIGARELLLDAMKLGVNVSLDTSFIPDFLIALWPGGVSVGLPVHEVFKYRQKKTGNTSHKLDHVSINTTKSHLSYRTNVIGIPYLEERINKHHNLLIVDTTFRSGRMVNDVIMKLKGVMRRNLDLNRVRVASVYYNPDDKSTWTVQPIIKRPHYYLKKVKEDVIYPQNVMRLPHPRKDLKRLAPKLAHTIWGNTDT